MMIQKFVITGILCLGLLPAIQANDGEKKVKTTSSRQAKTTGRVKKDGGKVKTAVLRTTTASPAMADRDASPTKGFDGLFENSAALTATVKLNPRAVSYVQNYIEKNSDDLLQLKKWGRPYFNIIDGVLRKKGLPGELKYLAVVESELKASALSRVGAVGPWQLMSSTARDLGLKVTHTRDERRDYYKSTVAASKYLKDLYNEFGDWLLVIAAYNSGPAPIYNAIKRSGSRSFWNMQYYLPAETRNHVKRFIGTHYIFEGEGGITTLTKAETAEQIIAVSRFQASRNLSTAELQHAKSMVVTGKYQSAVIARNVSMEIDEFNRYNPNFDRVMATVNNSYSLKLPSDKMELFMANKYQILNESIQLLLNGASASANK